MEVGVQSKHLKAEGRNADQNSLNLALAELPKNFKIEFPRFNGNDPRSWIRKCNKFFNFNSMLDESKVFLAQIYLDDKVDQWFQGYQEEVGVIGWSKLVDEILVRYATIDLDPVKEFKTLK